MNLEKDTQQTRVPESGVEKPEQPPTENQPQLNLKISRYSPTFIDSGDPDYSEPRWGWSNDYE